jgi:hypothetical protein
MRRPRRRVLSRMGVVGMGNMQMNVERRTTNVEKGRMKKGRRMDE